VENGRLIVSDQAIPFTGLNGERATEIAIRPENVILTDQSVAGEVLRLPADVRKVTFLGREAHYTLNTAIGEIIAQVADPSADFITMEGQAVGIRLPLSKISLFDRNGDVVRTGLAR
jgi:hypothetical protein